MEKRNIGEMRNKRNLGALSSMNEDDVPPQQYDDRRINDKQSKVVYVLGIITLCIIGLVIKSNRTSEDRVSKGEMHEINVFQKREVVERKGMIIGYSRKLKVNYEHVGDNPEVFLKHYGNECSEDDAVYKRYMEMKDDEILAPFGFELWKYCVLYARGGVYLDSDSPLLFILEDVLKHDMNYAVKGSVFPNTIHGSLLALKEAKSMVAREMLHLLIQTSNENLVKDPLLVSRRLFDFVQDSKEWTLLQQNCIGVSSATSYSRSIASCPPSAHYCCEILKDEKVLLISPHPLLPNLLIPPISTLPKPYLYQTQPLPNNLELAFISTIREKIHPPPPEPPLTPNLYQMLLESDCLPSSQECSLCLRNKQGSDCKSCETQCNCYCKALCSVAPEPKFISKHFYVSPPLFSKDPSRLIPRIIHQTWFEPVHKEKYPNMSRLINSWKQSGWEYRFYDDDTAADFLRTHFPPEVLQAYQSVIPGAFKADLFRYCVLFIHGGVYSDMDVMLESNLDAAIAPDVGFMTPMDEPGTPVDRRMCLWNGLIASAPAHPFLAAVIEHVVNNIRNRYTSVDIDNLLCPNPELSVSHAFDTLFTAGPCILGLAINQVLNRDLQTQYAYGELNLGQNIPKNDVRHSIPGRSIILRQNKMDIGAHRFTLDSENLIVAATDMPDYDDRKKLETNVHYSETHVKTGVYGVDKLYVDNVSANEVFRIEIEDASVSIK